MASFLPMALPLLGMGAGAALGSETLPIAGLMGGDMLGSMMSNRPQAAGAAPTNPMAATSTLQQIMQMQQLMKMLGGGGGNIFTP